MSSEGRVPCWLPMEMNHLDVSQEMETEISPIASVMEKRNRLTAKEFGDHTAWLPVAPLCFPASALHTGRELFASGWSIWTRMHLGR